MFASHFISENVFNILMRDNFSVNDFNEFVLERAKTITSYINKTIFEIEDN